MSLICVRCRPTVQTAQAEPAPNGGLRAHIVPQKPSTSFSNTIGMLTRRCFLKCLPLSRSLVTTRLSERGLDYVDLQQYPITELTSTGAQNLISHCQNQLKLNGSVRLEGFIRSDCIEQMCEQVLNLESHRRLEIFEVMKADHFVDKNLFQQDLPDDHPIFFKVPQVMWRHAVPCFSVRSFFCFCYCCCCCCCCCMY